MGAPGPAIGEPVPGIRCVSVCPSTDLTLTARRTGFCAPKARKVILDLPERAKTSYTYEKVRLGRFGSAKVQKVQLFALLRFGPPRTGKYVGHVCKSAKVTFCNFLFFEILQFSSLFDRWPQPLCFPMSNQWFFGQNAPKPTFCTFTPLGAPK